MPRRLPDAFVLGVATSSYQIEGAADQRGASIWDRFAATPGAIADGSDGRVACDHVNRFRDDVALMRELGVDAYRFSVAWPRVLPAGTGQVSEAGLDFYDRLLDALIEAGISPYVTLYHWDLPQALQERGGWAARSTAEAFVAYADIVARRLGDRAKHWVTHNEPWCIATLGHETGEHAPGFRDPVQAIAVRHHLLLSHGWAVPVVRAAAPGAEVGIVLNVTPAYAASASAPDHDAARRLDGAFQRWFLDPLYGRGYPSDLLDDHVAAGHLQAPALPWALPGDMEAIATATDFVGLNYYSRAICRGPEEGNAPREIAEPDAAQRTDMGWEIYPRGLRDILVRVQVDYAPAKILITENGCAFATGPDANGAVQDSQRVRYLRDHIAAALDARSEGVPVSGYFAWSLLDNFEWAHGYNKRFGLVWVDYATQRRIPKASALWYQNLLATRVLVPLE